MEELEEAVMEAEAVQDQTLRGGDRGERELEASSLEEDRLPG